MVYNNGSLRMQWDNTTKNVYFKYDNGKLIDARRDKEMLFIHFSSKKKNINVTKTVGNVFIITDMPFRILLNKVILVVMKIFGIPIKHGVIS